MTCQGVVPTQNDVLLWCRYPLLWLANHIFCGTTFFSGTVTLGSVHYDFRCWYRYPFYWCVLRLQLGGKNQSLVPALRIMTCDSGSVTRTLGTLWLALLVPLPRLLVPWDTDVRYQHPSKRVQVLAWCLYSLGKLWRSIPNQLPQALVHRDADSRDRHRLERVQAPGIWTKTIQ